MHRRSRDAPTAESRVRSITQAAPDAPFPSPEAPVPIPPPPYAAGEPPPPEPPPEPVPPPRIRYEDDGMLGPPYTDRADEPPGPEQPPTAPPFSDAPAPPVGEPGAAPESRPSFAAYDDGPSGPLARIRNLVAGDELDPGRPGLRVLLVVGVVAVLVGGWYWWRARPHQEPLHAPSPAASAGARPHPLPGTPSAPASPSASASPSATAVVVDVAGKVRHPGVVHLRPGSRVVDAIHAAGGAKRGVPTGALNLARIVVDGEQIRVGASGTPPPGPSQPSGSPSPGATGGSPGTTGGAGVSLNNATQEQLESLSGVGPVLAKHILDYRTQHGGFRSVDELRDVTGIGPKRFADLKSEVTP